MVAPASRFSNTADTGIRVSRNTHAPPSLPGTLSTAGHWDQSRVAMFLALLFLSTTVRQWRHALGCPGSHPSFSANLSKGSRAPRRKGDSPGLQATTGLRLAGSTLRFRG